MKPLIPIALLLYWQFLHAQTNEFSRSYDSNWKPVPDSLARFIVHAHPLSDTCWQFDYYRVRGPLVKAEQFRDAQGTQRHGICHYYDSKGSLDSIGQYHKGKREGDFYRVSCTDSLHYLVHYAYKDDILVETEDYRMQKNRNTKAKYDKESEFPGGMPRWIRYLNKNLHYPKSADKGRIQGEVIIFFTVDENGVVLNPYPVWSVELSLDDEALRIIRGSGDWEPATRAGEKVKSYKLQPVIFKLEE